MGLNPFKNNDQQDPEKRTPEVLENENNELKQQVTDLEKENKELREQLESKAPAKIKGVLIDVGDPFGLGAVRAYRGAGGKSKQPDRLPFVLPEGEEASKKALENYLLRADGGGDKKRAEIARKALKKFKKS